MKIYYVKDGELQYKEVDADFFKKNTTLGGLLSSDEVELDRDNKIVPDSVGTIEVTAENWGKSAILEKVKKIREALEKATDYSYEPPVSIVADHFEYSHEPLDVASMYPGDAISDKATTLGGLLAPNEVDMASCDDLTVAPLLRFPYLTSNMMATDGQYYDEVELDRDNKIVPDSVGTIQVTTRNWGKSAILEKAKEIREALESATTGTSGWELGMKRLGEAIEKPTEYYPEKWISEAVMHNLEDKIIADMDGNGDLHYRSNAQEGIDNIQIHEKICKELTETYKKKNADYGNSFENSLDKHGLIAGIVRMDDKMSRLISLNSKNEQLVLDESLRDTLMDLANYAIMSVMWLDEQ